MAINDRCKKVVFVGDSNVGKTTILKAYINKHKHRFYVQGRGNTSTLDLFTTKLTVDDHDVKLDVWDSYGLEDYTKLRVLCYPDTDVFVVCFAVSNRNSFANVELRWVPEIRHYCPGVPFVLVANQVDLRKDSPVDGGTETTTVTTVEGFNVSRKVGAFHYVECSAVDDDGVRDVFEVTARATLPPSTSAVSGRSEICRQQ